MILGSRPSAVVAAAVLVCSGCGIGIGIPAADPPGTAPPTSTTPSRASPVSASPTADAPSVPVPTLSLPIPGTAGGKQLTTSTRKISGRYAKATWVITVPTFAASAAAPEINRRVDAAVSDIVAQTKKLARDDNGARRTVTGQGTVVTNDGRTAQITITYVDYVAGAAHPSDYVTTTVIDVRRSRPVLFSDVVQNPPEGMRYLATQVKAIAKSKGEDVTESDGLSAKLSNWAAWQSNTKGMIFVFGDYQLGGLGLRTYTVPWSKAKLVLSSYGEKLLLPS